jgi:EmrB/QacA subfamily drug resistance transporter
MSEGELTGGHPLRWRVLAVLSLIQFSLLLDDTIVNVSLPTIREDLDMSVTSLAWVVNAYVLAFGGLLLLGGRIADLRGPRRVFLVGVTIFGLASLANALATSGEMLIASRAVQGLGAALTAPATLAMVTTLFADRRERTKALAILNSLAGLGGAAGVVLGGVITDLVDWRWIFYINIPVVAFALLYVGRRVRIAEHVQGGPFDVPGAATVTAGLVLLVYTLLETNEHEWLSARSLAGFAVAAALIALFVAIERRAERPLVRLGFFRHRRRNTLIGTQNIVNAAVYGTFFLVTLYMQRVLGYSPLEGGLAWLPLFGAFFLTVATAPKALVRLGVRPVLAAGLLLDAAGVAWMTQISVDGAYAAELVPGMVLFGLGLGWSYVAIGVGALYEAGEREAGLAAGLVFTSQQVGGALGIAVLVALADSRAGDLLAGGSGAFEAQVEATQVALAVAAGALVAGALLVVRLVGSLRPERMPEPAGVA